MLECHDDDDHIDSQRRKKNRIVMLEWILIEKKKFLIEFMCVCVSPQEFFFFVIESFSLYMLFDTFVIDTTKMRFLFFRN